MSEDRKYFDTDDREGGKQMVLNTDEKGEPSEVVLDLEDDDVVTRDEKEGDNG